MRPFPGGIMVYLLACLIGIIAGLRAMTAPAAVAWAAYLGVLDLSSSWVSFLGSVWAVGLLTALALAELVTDQLPSTPSRLVPQQFGARVVTGAISGAAIALPNDAWGLGLLAGILGAVIGTYGGATLRGWLAARFRRDPPAAIIEDAIAVIGAVLVISALSPPVAA